MTAREIAEYLRVHKTTLYRLLTRKMIPGFKIGGDWRFNVETIEAWRLSSVAEVGTIVKPRPTSRGKSARQRGEETGPGPRKPIRKEP